MRGVLVLVTVFATAFVGEQWNLGAKFVPADILFLLVVLTGMPSLLAAGPTIRVWRRLAPGFLALTAAGMVAIALAGFPAWGVSQLAKNIMPLVVLAIVTGMAIRLPAVRQKAILAYLLTSCVVAVTSLAGSTLRAAGTFNNPNYAANFLIIGLIVLIRYPARKLLKMAIAVLYVAGCYRTGSFAVFPAVAAATAVYLWQRLSNLPVKLRAFVRIALVLMAVLSAAIALRSSVATNEEVDLGSGLSTSRLDRSGTTRFEIWRTGLRIIVRHPLGIGPAGLRNRPELRAKLPVSEMHNDVLDVLLASGPVGLLGEVLIVVAIWRFGRRDPLLRALLAGCIASGMFRQVWNFRHMWLAIGLLLAEAICQESDRRRASLSPETSRSSSVVPTSETGHRS